MSGEQRQPELDYLRGLACVMVMLYHYLFQGHFAGLSPVHGPVWLQPLTEHLHFGVQLFFMISGYVIYKSATGRGLGDFVWARLWRLYPAYWAAIIITTVVVLACKADALRVSARDLAWNFTMFQGFARARNVDGVYWSLLVEMVFYLHVAAAIGLGYVDRAYRVVALWLSLAAFNAWLDSYWLDALLLARWAPYFSIGIMAYRLREGDRPLGPLLLCAVSLLLACHRIAVYGVRQYGHIDWAEIAMVFLLTVLFLRVVWRSAPVRQTRCSGWVGRLTYPMYLLHQNLGYLLISALALSLGPVASVLLTIGVMLLSSVILHVLVEQQLAARLRRTLQVLWRNRSEPPS